MDRTFRINKGICYSRISSVSKALVGLGYKRVESGECDVLVVWNGMRMKVRRLIALAKPKTTLFLEHGFINRGSYHQIDTKGFLHNASWANDFDKPLPEYAEKRLSALVNPVPVAPRSSGYVLILGQVDGDTQMKRSPFKRASELLSHVAKALPPGVEAVFRRHPNKRAGKHVLRESDYPGVKFTESFKADTKGYGAIKEGTTLSEDLAGCRFAIAINSNALVDATIAGVPCMAFGPSLGINAGVFKSARVESLGKDIESMLSGWSPKAGADRNFLCHLCCHQWTSEELSDPVVIKACFDG